MLMILISTTEWRYGVYDGYLWSGWAYRSWQAWNGNFQRTNRQALKGNITPRNKRISDVMFNIFFYRDIEVGVGRYGAITLGKYIMEFVDGRFVRKIGTKFGWNYMDNFDITILDVDDDGYYDFIRLFGPDAYWVNETGENSALGVILDPPSSSACQAIPSTAVIDRRTKWLFFTEGFIQKIIAFRLYKDSTGRFLNYDTLWMLPYENFHLGFISMADFNDDGYHELVIPYSDSTVIYDIYGNKLWSFPKGVYKQNGVLVDDINGDEIYEVVIPSDGVYAYRYDGTPLWEFHPSYPIISASLSSGDIDYDGITEIITIADSLYVLDGRNGSKKWSAYLNGYPINGQGAKLADIDPTNPGMEIIIPLFYGGGLKVFSSDGRFLWEEFTGEQIWGASIADVDMDLCADILVMRDLTPIYGYRFYVVSLIRGDSITGGCGNILGVEEITKKGDKGTGFKNGYIYSVDGRLISKGENVKLPRGVYFYVYGNRKKKVIVW